VCHLCAQKQVSVQKKLYTFDATTVNLRLSHFPWAKCRTTKGGIKLHTLLDHDRYLQAFIKITAAKEPISLWLNS
jgi:putative transposase